MIEMIDRVAQAITKTFEGEGRVFDDGQAEQLACAAMGGMREPTQAMLDAAQEVLRECLDWSSGPGEGLDGVDFARAWRAMIDAALRPTNSDGK